MRNLKTPLKRRAKRILSWNPGARRLGQQGVTLVELMLTAAVLSLFLGATASFWVSYTRCVAYLDDCMDIGNEAMVSRSLMIHDLSAAQSVSWGPHQGWVLNINGGASTQVSYWLDGDHLMMEAGNPGIGSPVAHRLSNAQFSVGGPWTASTLLTFQKGKQSASLEIDFQQAFP